MIKSLYKKIIPEKTRIKWIQKFSNFSAFLYLGHHFYCNLCNLSFRKFKPKGNGLEIRVNAICPKCKSNERTRLLYEYLQQETSLFKAPLKVLHIAPEKTLYNKLINSNCEYIDADINPALATYQMDITNIKYPNNYFDIIICAHVLGHIPNERKAINELYRVLNTNGKLLLQTLIGSNKITFEDKNITTPKDRLENYGEYDLVRLHGQDFETRLKKEHSKVTVIDYRTNFSEEFCKKNSFGNGKRELIFLCEKITKQNA